MAYVFGKLEPMLKKRGVKTILELDFMEECRDEILATTGKDIDKMFYFR